MSVQGSRLDHSTEVETRLQELAEWGVDLSLITSSLARSPRERLELMQGRLALIEALRKGMKASRSQTGAAAQSAE